MIRAVTAAGAAAGTALEVTGRGKDHQAILKVVVLVCKRGRGRAVIALGHTSIVAQNAQLK